MECTERDRLRILIVGDEPQFSGAIRLALGDQGYYGCVDCPPPEAAQLATIIAPHLVIVVAGSDGPGIQLLAMKLRAQQPWIRCLLIANRGTMIELQLADQPWAQVVTRPFSMLRFISAIDSITERENLADDVPDDAPDNVPNDAGMETVQLAGRW